MASREAQKGSRLERACVNTLRALGLESHRSRGSDGRSLLLDQKVDVVVKIDGSFRNIQCKNDETVPAYVFVDKATRLIEKQTGDSFIVLPEARALEWLLSWDNGNGPISITLGEDYSRKIFKKDLKPDHTVDVLIQVVTRNRKPTMWIVREDFLTKHQAKVTND